MIVTKRVLAFDIGIKNLAWAIAEKVATNVATHQPSTNVAEKVATNVATHQPSTNVADKSGTTFNVRGWSNENLITRGTADSDSASNTCKSCKHKAVYGDFCVRHCPSLTPALRDLSGNLLKKIPSVSVLKEIATKHGADKPALKNKETVLAFLRTKFLFPKVIDKVKKIELIELHDGMRSFILKNKALFSSCSEILLENQPVLKNPVMKSVQMMLFATLRDLLEPIPLVRLVHASRKTTGVETAKGDEGYTDRKNAAEARISKGLEKGEITMACADGRDAAWFGKQAKRSDLADCLSMVMDSF